MLPKQDLIRQDISIVKKYIKRINTWRDKLKNMTPDDPKVAVYEFNIDYAELMIEYYRLKNRISLVRVQKRMEKFQAALIKHCYCFFR